jgi:hypothetical protein
MAANASLGWPLALVGGEAHDLPYRNIRRRAAKAARTSEKGALVKPSENKSTRLCRHNLLRVSAIKNLGGHDDCLDTDENLEFAERRLFISHRVISRGDFSGLAVQRAEYALWERT